MCKVHEGAAIGVRNAVACGENKSMLENGVSNSTVQGKVHWLGAKVGPRATKV